MRWLVVMLIAVIAFLAIMSMPLSLAPGLSAKNVVLYMLICALVFRSALQGLPAPEMSALHAVFALWVIYAIGSWLVAALVVQYPNYDLLDNAITLKAELLDSMLFFLVAYHALSDEADVKTVLKALVAAVGIANVATLADLAGIANLGIRVGTEGAEEGRVFGVFGHANDTAAVIICLLPVSVAVTLGSRGLARAIWAAFTFASLAVLLLTVSRGAYVGGAVGCLWAAWLCRRFVPLHRMAMWAFGGGVAIVAAVTIAGLVFPGAAEIITTRLLGGGVGAEQVSSGRTAIWQQALDRMLDQPISFITGFGWDAYWVMPFRFATHNYYLHLWFNLGLAGLGAFIALLTIGVRRALRAAATSGARLRANHVAFVFGILMLAVTVFFCNVEGQWALIWIYFGASMRAIRLDLAGEATVLTSEPVWRPSAPIRTGLAASSGRFVAPKLR